MGKKEKRKKVVVDCFICHGLDLPEGVASGNQACRCPFCHKQDHFFVDAATGLWDCKFCGEHGNHYTFLAKMAERFALDMPAGKLAALCEARGLPSKVFRRYKVGWNGEEYTIPIYSEKGTIRDIRRWEGPGHGVWSTHFCHLQLGGLYELANSTREQRVWLCEGEWDAFATRWMLDNSGHKFDIVVWLPGASSFQDKWVEWFRGREVICCFDNDEPGDKGALKAEMMLRGTAKKLWFLNWPDTRPSGYDMNDLIREAIADGSPMRGVYQTIETMLSERRRRDVPPQEGGAADPLGRSQEPVRFDEVLGSFRKWLKLNKDFEIGLAICLAICLSNELRHDPLWMYLIGPAGSGKTIILMALNDSPKTAFYSNLTPASLVSGFNIHPDPSILPNLNGKTAIFKDGTELLGLHPEARSQIYGTLRGAYDGEVRRIFGHGVKREYKDLHFNLIMGVTPAIHADNQANMGERFLKYEMREEVREVGDKIRRAIDNILQEAEMGSELSEVCRRFLLNEPDLSKLPGIGIGYIEKLVALAQIVAMLRAQVDRETFGDRDIKYRPVHETGTRVAKQMAKLARMLCVVYEIPEVDERIYKIVRRVAMDTCTGFNVDIIRAMMRCGNPGLSREQISDASKIGKTTMLRKLEDLGHLGIVTKRRAETRVRLTGSLPALYTVTEEVASLWRKAWDLPDPPPAPAVPRPLANGNGHALQSPKRISASRAPAN